MEILKDDTTNLWNTCPNSFRINASNPCGELVTADNTSCNLASLNLCKFYNSNTFDIAAFKHAVRLWTIVLDISCDIGRYPSKQLTENTYKYRPLGLGYCNLGALLMRTGVAYDSHEGRNIAISITSLMTAESYKTSAELATKLGAFSAYSKNKTEMDNVIQAHYNEAKSIYTSYTDQSINKTFVDVWNEAKKNEK